MFVYIRSAAFVSVVTQKQFFSSPKTSQQSVRKPYRPLILFNISLQKKQVYITLGKNVSNQVYVALGKYVNNQEYLNLG